MSSFPRLRILTLAALLVATTAPGVLAEGLAEPGESTTYDVRLVRFFRGGADGMMTFTGNEGSAGNSFDQGDAMLEVLPAEDGQTASVSNGRWASLDFGRIALWFAQTESSGDATDGEAGSEFFFFGYAFGDRLIARACVRGEDAVVSSGRYLLIGSVAETQEEPPVEEPLE